VITNAVVTILASLFTSGTVGTFIATIFSRRSKREREQDLRKLQAEKERLDAEHDKISAEAAEVALRSLRNELNAAYEDVEKRRKVIAVQDAHIEELGKTVRKQTKRIVALEEWAGVASHKFEQLGIEDMPPVPHEVNGG
jgi:hypothetical protein